MATTLTFLCACLLSAPLQATREEPFSRPNVLLVYADDMG